MEPLSDPCNDRMVKSTTTPPHRPLTHELLFPHADGRPDWQLLKEHFFKEGRLTKQDCIQLINKMSQRFGLIRLNLSGHLNHNKEKITAKANLSKDKNNK